jgi:hypothetical protein
VIDVNYPVAFPDDYLRSEVCLEIGPLASWLPYGERSISCYAAEAFPKLFDQRECAVKVIKAERTFWEKATILHHEAHRPEGNAQPPRYSRPTSNKPGLSVAQSFMARQYQWVRVIVSFSGQQSTLGIPLKMANLA